MDWNFLLTDVLAELPGVEKDLAERTIVRVAQDLFRKTKDYIRRLPAKDVVKGTATYTFISDDADFSIDSVYAVYYDKTKLSPLVQKQKYSDTVNDWKSASEGKPSFYYVDYPFRITLYPTPDESKTGALVVDAVMVPSDTCSGLDARYLLRYRDALLSGTLAELYAMHGKPWSSFRRAEASFREYYQKVNSLRMEGMVEHTGMGLRAAARRWL